MGLIFPCAANGAAAIAAATIPSKNVFHEMLLSIFDVLNAVDH